VRQSELTGKELAKPPFLQAEKIQPLDLRNSKLAAGGGQSK
jgi:hypothetical protein